jgi:hypothetical protein
MGINMSEFIAKRFKAAAAVLIVGLLPVIVKAIEAGTGFDIPGAWEQSWNDWVLALLAGIGVNYTDNLNA